MDIGEHFQKLWLKAIMPKRKAVTIAITPTQKKMPWVPNIGPKIRKEF